MKKNLEEIRRLIVKGHKMGVCDRNGNSVYINGHPIAKPMPLNSASKTYVVRKGIVVLKGT